MEQGYLSYYNLKEKCMIEFLNKPVKTNEGWMPSSRKIPLKPAVRSFKHG